ncbi:carbohydrate-binding module family 13 [Piromyces sp. E2]|nr:carbohydrate-binding module family 13 [Piromyces sp. E2]|eukprot:OUM63437.1 carbohydrate-binding module family 13 [Piromyces sp. E2]
MKSLSLIIIACHLLVASITPVRAANTLKVDCSNKIRGVTHCANGSLYGIIENVPADYKNLVDPIHPFVMRNPARGSNGNQHPYGDAIKVAKRLAATPGALVSIDLADILPYWPYQWPGMQNWANQLKSFIDDKKRSGLTNWYGLEIWNEPDGTWKDSNGLNFNEFWKQTYQVIRQNDPNEKIIGPCDSWYNENRMRSFLQFCKTNNVIPDIMCWHELSGIENVSNHIKAYRNLEKSLGIKELPISINEYCDTEHELEGQPGSSARFIGKFERYKIDSAMISWWFVPKPGRLGSLLATDTQKGAGWYFYKWYGDMTGDMVMVTPPNDNSKLVDGAACVDSSKEYVSFIFGGPNDGTINVNFSNIPSFIGSVANVKVEKVDWKNKDTPSNGPNTIFEKKYSVENGQISLTVTGTNGSSGYRVFITKGDGSGYVEPAPQRPVSAVATGTYNIINRQSGKALGVNNDSTANAANVVQWSENGKASQKWVITEEGDYFSIINVNANKALDVDNNSTANGGNVIIWPDGGNLNQRWSIQATGDGYFTITNANSGKNLDVEKGSMSDGGNVLQWDNNGNANQQWKLVRLDKSQTQTQTQNASPSSQTQTQTQAQTSNPGNKSPCSNAILNQGYKCCYRYCQIVYEDESGTWGYENNEWCGCSHDNTVMPSCPNAIRAQGYKCCSNHNCDVYATDQDGKWGIENNEWCGITDNCN